MGARFFVEYGALQERTESGPRRVIECTTSALVAVKIDESFARKIADALNAIDDPERAALAKEARDQARRCIASFFNCCYQSEAVNEMLTNHAVLLRKLAKALVGPDEIDRKVESIFNPGAKFFKVAGRRG